MRAARVGMALRRLPFNKLGRGMDSDSAAPWLDEYECDDTQTLLGDIDMNDDPDRKSPSALASRSYDAESAAQFGSLTPQQRKMALVADALEECGMGRYQWCIFCLCGFGYALDLMWAQAFSLVTPRIQVELGIPESQYGDIFSVFHAGLTVGAAVWGVLVDVVGRRVAFNCTVAIVSVFGLVIGALDSWAAILAVSFFVGFGLGGNIPIDATIVMEFIPKKQRWLLAALSVFQPLGVITTALIAWGLVPKYACPYTSPSASCSIVAPGEPCCTKASNYGWRYAVFTLGALSLAAFLARFVLFTFRESPRFLVSHGRDAEAVDVVRAIAKTNGRTSALKIEDLIACDRSDSVASDATIVERSSKWAAVRHVAELFATWRMARLTLLTWAVYAGDYWGFSIAGAFLPKLLAQRGAKAKLSTSATYRQYIWTALPGVPGVLLGAALIEVPALGRRWALVLTSAAMGAMLMSFVSIHTPHASVALNAFEYFFQSAFNAVLYGWTPEAFPVRVRGSAAGLASCVGRVASIVAPLVAARAGAATTGLYLAGGGVFLASVLCAFLPDTRRREVL